MKVLVVFAQKEILDTVVFALETKPGIEVIKATSDKEGTQVLSEQKDSISAVVMDGAESGLTSFSVVMKSLKLDIPFIICLKGQAKDQLKIDGVNVLGIADYTKLSEDVPYFLSTIKPKAEEPTAIDKSEEEAKYSKVGTNLLIRLSPLDAGVFVRLSSKKFVKLFQKGDNFTGEDLKRYQDVKKINHMYLLNEDTKIFMSKLNAELIKLLNSGSLNVRDANDLIMDSLETAQEIILQIGATEEVKELVTTNIATSMKVMGEFPELGSILKQMQIDKDKYIPSHSMQVAHIACALAVAMDWYSDATFQKLTCAAFMHDVALRDHELCAVKSLQDLEKNYKGKFNTRDIQEYKGHPKRAAMLVAGFKEIGAEVDKVILQHHEHPSGSGFPDALNASYIAPLSTVFIVAHDLVDYAYDHEGKINMEDFIVQNENKLSAGNFKKVLKALMKMNF